MPEEEKSLHQKIWPYTTEVTQHAIDRGPDKDPWIVRDRQAALRAERQGRGKALFRVWMPTDWYEINAIDKEEE